MGIGGIYISLGKLGREPLEELFIDVHVSSKKIGSRNVKLLNIETMEEQLPREILWADKKTMKEFLCEPLNQNIYEVYLNIKRDGVIKDYETLKLFNEVHYQCSRIVNCEDQDIKLIDIISDIKNNLGWHFSSSLVVNMIYAVLSLRRNNSPSVIRLISRIKEHYRLETYETPLSKMVKECAERDERYTIEFPLHKNNHTIITLDSSKKQIEKTVLFIKRQILSSTKATFTQLSESIPHWLA